MFLKPLNHNLSSIGGDIEIANVEAGWEVRQLAFSPGLQVDEPQVLVSEVTAHEHKGTSSLHEAQAARRPTPPADQAATFTHYPDVAGFFIANGRRFLMEAPQPLSSSRYAADFDEAKSVGAVNSTTRTADQTKMARLWHGVGTTTTSPNLWNVVLIDVARARGWSGLDLARGLALMNMTQHDALLTSFTGKFLYGFWRPVTAIREAASDNNPATEPDANWTPLLHTPSYPGHHGNRACLSASQARLLQRLFGQDDVSVQVTWQVSSGPPETRRYNGFQQLADEEAKSRIWGGIHFEFESLASRGSCSQLADYGADNVLRQR